MLCSFRNLKGLFYAHFLTKTLRRTNWWKKVMPPYRIKYIDNSLMVESASNPTIVHIIAAIIGHCSVWANIVVGWVRLCWFHGRSFFTTRPHNSKGKVLLLLSGNRQILRTRWKKQQSGQHYVTLYPKFLDLNPKILFTP